MAQRRRPKTTSKPTPKTAPTKATSPPEAAPEQKIEQAPAPTADDVLAAARTEADTIRQTAREDADKTLATATATADELRAAAQNEADTARSSAHTDAEQLLSQAREEAAQTRKTAAQDATTAREEAEDARRALAAAEAELKRVTDDAARAQQAAQEQNGAGQALFEQSRGRAEHLIGEAEEMVYSRRSELMERLEKAADTEAAAKKAQVEAETTLHTAQHEAARLRADAERAIQQRQEEANRELHTAREQMLATARKEAEQIHSRAAKEAEETSAVARGKLNQAREQAQEHSERKKRRTARLETIWRNAPWAALWGAIGLTASGEYSLATLAGWPAQIAWMLPVTIDVYANVALRRGKDVPHSLALMFVANAIYHLAAAGIIGTDAHGEAEWYLIVGVAAIAPLVMWRVHRITHAERHEGERPTEGERVDGERAHPAPAVSAEGERRAKTNERERHEGERPTEGERPRVSVERERPAAKPAPRRERPALTSGTDKSSSAGGTTTNALMERRVKATRELWERLGRRPEWTEVRDAVSAASLSEEPISRPTAQRLREKADPGSDKTLALTGS